MLFCAISTQFVAPKVCYITNQDYLVAFKGRKCKKYSV